MSLLSTSQYLWAHRGGPRPCTLTHHDVDDIPWRWSRSLLVQSCCSGLESKLRISKGRLADASHCGKQSRLPPVAMQTAAPQSDIVILSWRNCSHRNGSWYSTAGDLPKRRIRSKEQGQKAQRVDVPKKHGVGDSLDKSEDNLITINGLAENANRSLTLQCMHSVLL